MCPFASQDGKLKASTERRDLEPPIEMKRLMDASSLYDIFQIVDELDSLERWK